MSISTFVGIQTSLRGLLAQQRALDVTSHNISNASTAGYSRQEALLATTDSLQISGVNGGMLGTGVDVQEYRRIRDQFLDLQYRGQSMSLGEQSTRSDSLGQVELALAEPGANGISTRLSDLWDSWANLSNSATNPAARQAVIDKARTLASAINDLQSGLKAAKDSAQAEYDSLASAGGEISQVTSDLRDTLNAIRNAEKTGAQPNDLYDRRDLLLDHLWTLGQVSIDTAGGGDVLLGGQKIIDVDPNGVATIPTGPSPFPLTFTPPEPGGKLAALMDLTSATGPIESYQQDLDKVIQTLTDLTAPADPTATGSINFAYSAVTGKAFFTVGTNPATGHLEMHLNEADVTAATLKTGSGAAGDNSLALRIGALRGGEADKAYAQLVTRIGNEVSQANRQQDTAQVLTDNLKDRRDSVAGVSLDEEMTNIIRFQRAYQASARAMSTTDEMLDTLINRTGRVGL